MFDILSRINIPRRNLSARLSITIRGSVQGVGFRPFIYRLAVGLGLKGWVNNSPQGVRIEADGPRRQLETFLLEIDRRKPAHVFFQSFEYAFLDPAGYPDFKILESDVAGDKTATVLPDISTCPQCLSEIFDRKNRRYLYPFTNCTHCGPRFSIIESLPYDRPGTSMKGFSMCEKCQKEYNDPLDRRFHAQPNACPECGPQLELWGQNGGLLFARHEALMQGARAIKEGKILAVKGLGGFHLIADARNDESVKALRERKQREEKPFALMFPTLESVQDVCRMSLRERQILTSSETPIVLLKRHQRSKEKKPIAPSVAPGNPYLGAMLPYTPLHHMLMRELNFPIVATSGNISDEPICTDEKEALERLKGIADLFLLHNRPIVRPVDDSVVRLVAGRPLVLRRARGYAPLPVTLKKTIPSILGVGAHLKNTVALGVGDNVFISQHIGDLETALSYEAFKQSTKALRELYNCSVEKIACDLHPDYFSTGYAKEQSLPVVPVQHHHAHVVSCMAENELNGNVLGVSWDGTGFGSDETIWGGEFLLSSRKDFKRVAHLRTFMLPGGDAAVKEPRRTALGVLYEIFGEEVFTWTDLPGLQTFGAEQLTVIRQMMGKKINSPRTSSAGRLFDAVSSLIGLAQHVHFEGQAAMALEYALEGIRTRKCYPFEVIASPGGSMVDWSLMIRKIVKEYRSGVNIGTISAKFHNTLVEMIVRVAKANKEEHVVLSGGCFQNKYLTENVVRRLQEEGFRPYWHQRVPPNDGGISLGQVVVAAMRDKG